MSTVSLSHLLHFHQPKIEVITTDSMEIFELLHVYIFYFILSLPALCIACFKNMYVAQAGVLVSSYVYVVALPYQSLNRKTKLSDRNVKMCTSDLLGCQKGTAQTIFFTSQSLAKLMAANEFMCYDKKEKTGATYTQERSCFRSV